MPPRRSTFEALGDLMAGNWYNPPLPTDPPVRQPPRRSTLEAIGDVASGNLYMGPGPPIPGTSSPPASATPAATPTATAVAEQPAANAAAPVPDGPQFGPAVSPELARRHLQADRREADQIAPNMQPGNAAAASYWGLSQNAPPPPARGISTQAGPDRASNSGRSVWDQSMAGYRQATVLDDLLMPYGGRMPTQQEYTALNMPLGAFAPNAPPHLDPQGWAAYNQTRGGVQSGYGPFLEGLRSGEGQQTQRYSALTQGANETERTRLQGEQARGTMGPLGQFIPGSMQLAATGQQTAQAEATARIAALVENMSPGNRTRQLIQAERTANPQLSAQAITENVRRWQTEHPELQTDTETVNLLRNLEGMLGIRATGGTPAATTAPVPGGGATVVPTGNQTAWSSIAGPLDLAYGVTNTAAGAVQPTSPGTPGEFIQRLRANMGPRADTWITNNLPAIRAYMESKWGQQEIARVMQGQVADPLGYGRGQQRGYPQGSYPYTDPIPIVNQVVRSLGSVPQALGASPSRETEGRNYLAQLIRAAANQQQATPPLPGR